MDNVHLSRFLILFLSGVVQAGEPSADSSTLLARPRAVLRDSIQNINSPESSSAPKPLLRLNNSYQTIHGGVNIGTVVVAAEQTKFSFILPFGWLTQSEASEKTIRLVRPGDEFIITIHIVETGSLGIPQLSRDLLREKLVPRFPEGSIMDETFVSALGQSGPAFDVEWRAASNIFRASRCAFIPFSGGYLECNLTAAPNKFRQARNEFNQLLLSLRSAPVNGKLDFQPVTPE